MKKQIIIGVIMGLLSGALLANAPTLEVPVLSTLTVTDEAANMAATITTSESSMTDEQIISVIEVDFNRAAGFSIDIDSANAFKLQHTDTNVANAANHIPYKIKCTETAGLNSSVVSGMAASGHNTYTLSTAQAANGNCVNSSTFVTAASDLKFDVKLTIDSDQDLREALESATAGDGGTDHNYGDTLTISLVDKTPG